MRPGGNPVRLYSGVRGGGHYNIPTRLIYQKDHPDAYLPEAQRKHKTHFHTYERSFRYMDIIVSDFVVGCAMVGRLGSAGDNLF